MSLAETLEKIREGAKERIPLAAREKMERATEELRESGILSSALGEGAHIPRFKLPNASGEVFRSSDLLNRNGLVLTFYRGVW